MVIEYQCVDETLKFIGSSYFAKCETIFYGHRVAVIESAKDAKKSNFDEDDADEDDAADSNASDSESEAEPEPEPVRSKQASKRADKRAEKQVEFIRRDDDSIVQGMFNLASITSFLKCCSLSDSIMLYIGNDTQIIIHIQFNMGDVRLYLEPKLSIKKFEE
jgi:(p)ppGpp synthase/HD superfamily hydrolase